MPIDESHSNRDSGLKPKISRQMLMVITSISILICLMTVLAYLIDKKKAADHEIAAVSMTSVNIPTNTGNPELDSLSASYSKLLMNLNILRGEKIISSSSIETATLQSTSEGDEHEMLEEAKQKIFEGKYKEAQVIIEKLLQVNPLMRAQYDINMILGINAMLEDDLDMAEIRFNRALFISGQLSVPELVADARYRLDQISQISRGILQANRDKLKIDIDDRIAAMHDYTFRSLPLATNRIQGLPEGIRDLSGIVAAIEAKRMLIPEQNTDQLQEFFLTQNESMELLLGEMQQGIHKMSLKTAGLTPRPIASTPVTPELSTMSIGRSSAQVLEFASKSKSQMDYIVTLYGREYTNLSGGVRLRFTVGEDGNVSDVTVLESMWSNPNAAEKVNAALSQIVHGWAFKVGKGDKGDVQRQITLYY
jgi:TonB family protein